jgi:ABC-type transport system involved in cytochrome c biogenesis permease subunit
MFLFGFGGGGIFVLLDKLLKLALIAAVASFFLALGLLVGAILYAIVRRRWPLYVILPVVDCATYLWLLPKVARFFEKPMEFTDQFRQPQLDLTICAMLVLIPLGICSALILHFFSSLWRRAKRFFRGQSSTEGDLASETHKKTTPRPSIGGPPPPCED